MRQILLSFFMLLLMAGTYAQCPPGDLQFTSQEEVDDFIIDYPNCTQIQGTLRIGYHTQSDISNLQGLQNITEVVGAIVIQKTALTNLEGLNNLTTSSGGGLDIFLNDYLVDLKGLDNLTYSEGLTIYYNPNLESLEGIETLTNIGINLNIAYNERLENLNGLENLETVSYENVNGEIYIVMNNSLTSIEALNKLTTLGGQLLLSENPLLGNLDGLGNLSFVGGTLRLQNLPTLTNVNALSNLTSVNSYGGYIQLSRLPSLINLHGLEQITEVGGLFIIECNSLVDLSELVGLTNINSSLSSGDLYIYGNESLTTLNGLDNLNKVGFNTVIFNNPVLSTFEALSSLNENGCSITIDANPLLSNLEGLNNLTSMGTHEFCSSAGLNIANNPQLSNIQALENLSNLPIPNFQPEIKNNPLLESLSGLENVPSNKFQGIRLQSSQTLSTCNLPNICEYLSNGGQNQISGNATGCSSSEEILDLCALSIDEIFDAEEITLYPVPTKQVLNVSAKNNADIQHISVYDLTGKLVFSSKENQSKIDISHLVNGVYLVSVKTSKGIHNQKIIKQ